MAFHIVVHSCLECPFNGSRGTCGAIPDTEINECPDYDFDLNVHIPSKRCPLKDGTIEISASGDLSE